MNRLIYVFLFVAFSSNAFAATETGFFSEMGQHLSDIKSAFFGVPSMIERAFASFVQYSMLAKISFQLMMIKFALGVAQSLMIDLNITAMVKTVFQNIPASIGHYLNLYDIPNMIQFSIECVTTRFVLAFMGKS